MRWRLVLYWLNTKHKPLKIIERVSNREIAEFKTSYN